MSDKKISNFELSEALNKTSSDATFDEIVKEIDTSEIPSKYIERILVTYKDGSQIELSNEDVLYPLPSKKTTKKELQKSFNTIQQIRVFIDTKTLSYDVNNLLEKMLEGKFLE
jgi:myosin-crossreactive antigen